MRKFYLTLLLMLAAGINAMAENWMSRLPDQLYVAEVSIPGAHDAATGHGFESLLGSMFAQTQDLDLATQWSLGVRAFDLRPIVKDGYLGISHGIMETKLHFDEAMQLLRDSLIRNPSEFAVIHLLYADGFEDDKEAYRTMLLELLQSDGLKDYVVDFRRDLTVGQMRGKILLMSRDSYDIRPVGAFMTNWCGWIDWNVQTQGRVTGAGSDEMASGPLYMQDLSDTHEEGMVDTKVEAIERMLNFSTQHAATEPADIVWVYNFASAYCNSSISTSAGYRENATYTHAAFIDYFQSHEAGPAGIVLMDFVGVDESGDYAVRGKELLDTLIANNFKYVERMNTEVHDQALYQIERLNNRLTRVGQTIAEECPDVASDFADDLEEMQGVIDSIKAEADSLYAARLLTERYVVDYMGNYSLIQKILTAAREAQTTVGVESVRTAGERKVSRIYSLTGEQLDAPRRGAVNIVKYSDGTVRKVLF